MEQLEEVSIEVTNLCSQHCAHCSSGSSSDVDTHEELSRQVLANVIAQAKDLGAEVISFSGGDPLVYPDWRCLVDTATRLGMGVLFYTSGITEVYDADLQETTGMFVRTLRSVVKGISESDMKFLKMAFDRTWGKVIFSLEGASSGVHNDITAVDGSFHYVTQLAIPKAMELGLDVELHQTPMAANFPGIVTFLQMANELGIDKVSFLRLVPQGRAKLAAGKIMLTPKQFHQIQHVLYQWSRRPHVRIGCPLSFGHLYGYVDQRPRCHAGKDLLLVRPNGDVHCCAGWKECKQLVLGNVKFESLRDIWRDSSTLEMIRKFNREDGARGCCGSCPWRNRCGGGCPAQRVIFNQNNGVTKPWDQLMYGVDPMCPRYNKLLTDGQIAGNRTHLERMRLQDDKGNVVREVK